MTPHLDAIQIKTIGHNSFIHMLRFDKFYSMKIFQQKKLFSLCTTASAVDDILQAFLTKVNILFYGDGDDDDVIS